MNSESFESALRGKSSSESEKMGVGNGGRHDPARENVQSAMTGAKDAVGSAIKAGDNEISALQDQIGKLTQTVTQLVQSHASAARGQVMDAVGTASASVSQSAAAAQESLSSIEADVGARIKRNPWSAVAIAGLVGLLIGKMA